MKAIAVLQYFITGVKFCLAKHTQNVSINLQEAFMFICMQKVHLINIFFFQDIAKISATSYFGYFGHVWHLLSKKIIQTCGNFDAHLHAKNELHP